MECHNQKLYKEKKKKKKDVHNIYILFEHI